MKINRKMLLENLQKLMSGVDSGSGIVFEGSDSFTFTEKEIHSYNSSISVSVLVDTGLQGAIKSKEFFKLLQKLPTEEIEIIQEEGFWKLVSGNTEAELKLISSNAVDYVKQLNLQNLVWKELPEDFFAGIKLSKISCSSSKLRGIFVKDDEMISTDEVRINSYRIKSPMETFWVDDPSITELLRLGEVVKEYSLTEGWVHFTAEYP